MKLAERYGDHPAEEFPMLFQRILQNTIRDYYRRQKVRSFWTTLMSSLTPQHGGEDFDPLDTLQDEDNDSQPARPDEALAQSQLIAVIEEALSKLPARQREAFLLRYWEEMDTAETATAMGCSEGSVKTHCSRATHALSAILKRTGDRPIMNTKLTHQEIGRLLDRSANQLDRTILSDLHAARHHALLRQRVSTPIWVSQNGTLHGHLQLSQRRSQLDHRCRRRVICWWST